ncbi:PQQ-binding-like beta-propeller repeat protein [Streptomyces sp. MS1.HAVA.3]|uniref:PQQ-binding-like beta-propeller repeat protein n=1 Tax=Streptomyces caledonius TaxID=3134107 RepID=A0ABU8U5N0_9ACTN
MGGSVLAVGGGAAWWIGRGNRLGPFGIPPAVQTPQARVLDPKKGDYVLGATPEPLWSVASAVADDSPAPLPVRDVVIVGAPKGGIAAHSVVDGALRWSAPVTVAANRYLSLSDRLVAATDRNGTLVTFVASTGEPKWTSPAEAASLLAADDEAVYLITKDGRVRSIGRSDAKIRWTVGVDANLGSKAASRGLAAHGRLVIAAADGSVVALDTTDGRKAWDRREQSVDGRAMLAVSERSLCITGKNLSVLDIIDGKDLWSAENPKPPNGGAVFWAHRPSTATTCTRLFCDSPSAMTSGTAREPTGPSKVSSNATRPARSSCRGTASGRSPSTRPREASTSSTSRPRTGRRGCSPSSRIPTATGSRPTRTVCSSWTARHSAPCPCSEPLSP